MKLLDNKVAIITGASSGIGWAAAKLFAQQGARLVIAARRLPELNQLADDIRRDGGQVSVLVGDVVEEQFAKDLVDKALADYGQLDIALNNAGTLGDAGPTAELKLSAWQQVLNVNLTSAFLGAKYQAPAMLETGGSIIFTSSFVGYTVGMPQMAAYSASKAGIIGLTKSLAVEYGTSAVRVNALLPGGTITSMADAFGDSPEVVEYVENMHALKRRAQPEEIAQSALYLASDLSSFTTGAALLADGGVSINKS